MEEHTMKKQLLSLILAFGILPLFAQWVQVNNGLGNFQPTSMFAYVDTIVLGTYGGGVFRTLDNGENWIDVNGDIGSLLSGGLDSSAIACIAGTSYPSWVPSASTLVWRIVDTPKLSTCFAH